MNILLLGSESGLTHAALSGLLPAHPPASVLLAGPLPAPRPAAGRGQELPVEAPRSLAERARRCSATVVGLGPAGLAAARERLRGEPPDLLLVACFPHILDRGWRDWPRLGAVNVHPSLLPAYRGPVPSFWQLRSGERRTGVTLHRVTERVDGGPIVAQHAVRHLHLPDAAALERTQARLAAALVRGLVERLARAGTAAACALLAGWPQPEAAASRQGRPGPEALEIPTDWGVERAAAFLAGAGAWGECAVRVEGRRVPVREVLRVRPLRPDRAEPAVSRCGERLAVRFADGVLILR